MQVSYFARKSSQAATPVDWARTAVAATVIAANAAPTTNADRNSPLSLVFKVTAIPDVALSIILLLSQCLGVFTHEVSGQLGIFSRTIDRLEKSCDLRRREPLRPRAGGHRARLRRRRRQGRGQTQIKSVVCGFAGERSVSRNGVLNYKIDFKSFNDGITVFEYLQNNLWPGHSYRAMISRQRSARRPVTALNFMSVGHVFRT